MKRRVQGDGRLKSGMPLKTRCSTHPAALRHPHLSTSRQLVTQIKSVLVSSSSWVFLLIHHSLRFLGVSAWRSVFLLPLQTC